MLIQQYAEDLNYNLMCRNSSHIVEILCRIRTDGSALVCLHAVPVLPYPHAAYRVYGILAQVRKMTSFISRWIKQTNNKTAEKPVQIYSGLHHNTAH